MDVDLERVTDDERMTVDYDGIDEDGDAMMDDLDGGEEIVEEDEMDAEPTSAPLEDGNPSFSPAPTQPPNPFNTTPPITAVPSQPPLQPSFSAVPTVIRPEGEGEGKGGVGDDLHGNVGDEPFLGETISAVPSFQPADPSPSAPMPINELALLNTTAESQIQQIEPIQPEHSADEIDLEQSEYQPEEDELPEEDGDELENDEEPDAMTTARAGQTVGEDEEYYEEEEEQPDEVEDDGYPTDVHSLPPVILNLPALGARSLFAPLPPDLTPGKLPVWLSGKQEELGEASLSDVWSAVRAELARERLVQDGEMVIVQKQMALSMGEDDVNLQSITFLELVQLHHACGLSPPVQLHITFAPSRFGARFYAIQKEVMAQEERRKSLVPPASAADERDEDELGGDGEEAEDVNDFAPINKDAIRKQREEQHQQQRRERGGDEAHAEYGDSKHERRRERAAPPESEHPNADWAHSRLIHPVHVEGRRIIATPSVRDTEPEETLFTAAPATAPLRPVQRKAHDVDDDDDAADDVVEDTGVVEKANDHKKPIADEQDTVDTEDTESIMAQYREVDASEFVQDDEGVILPGETTPRKLTGDVEDEDEGVDVGETDPETPPTERGISDTYKLKPLDEIELRHQQQPSVTVPPPATPLTTDLRTPLFTSGVDTPQSTSAVGSPGASTPVETESERFPDITEESTEAPVPSYDDEVTEDTGTPVHDDTTDTVEAVEAVNNAADDEVDAAEQIAEAAEQIEEARAELDAKEELLFAKDEEFDAKEAVAAIEDAQDRTGQVELELEKAKAEKAQADADADGAEADDGEYDYDEEYPEDEDDYGVNAIADKGIEDSEEVVETGQTPVASEDLTANDPTYPDPSEEDQLSPTATIDDSPILDDDKTTGLPTTDTSHNPSEDRFDDTERDILSPVKRSFEDDDVQTVASKRPRGQNSE